MLLSIDDYIQHIIDTKYNHNVELFFATKWEISKKTPWIAFHDGDQVPELKTLLRWLQMADARVNLLFKDGTIQRLTEDLGSHVDHPFTSRWNEQKTKTNTQNYVELTVCDKTMSNYRHKNFPRRFSSILRLFTGMEIDIEIVDNDPAVPDIVYPVRPEDLP